MAMPGQIELLGPSSQDAREGQQRWPQACFLPAVSPGAGPQPNTAYPRLCRWIHPVPQEPGHAVSQTRHSRSHPVRASSVPALLPSVQSGNISDREVEAPGAGPSWLPWDSSFGVQALEPGPAPCARRPHPQGSLETTFPAASGDRASSVAAVLLLGWECPSFLPCQTRGSSPLPQRFQAHSLSCPGAWRLQPPLHHHSANCKDPTQRAREKPAPSLREGSGEICPMREPSPAWLRRAHMAGTRRAGPGRADPLSLGIRRKHGCPSSSELS